MLVSLYISFFDWDGLSPTTTFVGLTQLHRHRSSTTRSRSSRSSTTLVWTLGSLIVPTAIGLLLAVALNRGTTGYDRRCGRSSTPRRCCRSSRVGLIWAWMYNPQFRRDQRHPQGGRPRRVRRRLAVELSTRLSPRPSSPTSGSSVGFPMILYLAGLQAINKEFYEAARDRRRHRRYKSSATSPCRAFARRHVIVLSLTVISGFKVFDLIYTMTYGGPGRATQVLGTWMYFQILPVLQRRLRCRGRLGHRGDHPGARHPLHPPHVAELRPSMEPRPRIGDAGRHRI